MKAWQIFAVGAAGTVALLLLPLYEFVVAGISAVLILGAVVAGFVLRPRKTVFYVRTNAQKLDLDGNRCLDHECLALRLEIARLWLLFVPTFLVLAFLIAKSANGTLWNFDLLDAFGDYVSNWYWYVLLSRAVPAVVIGLISLWLNERWVLRDVEACSARSVAIHEGTVSFTFVVQGEYYGDLDFAVGLVRDRALTIVLYSPRKPDVSKIGMALVFHRLTIIGRGLTDLDEETASARAILAHKPA